MRSIRPILCRCAPSWILLAVLGSDSDLVATARAEDPLVQVHQDFSTDPGWESVNNRIEGTDCPTVKQDFGYLAEDPLGDAGGAIGGTIVSSTTSAFYGMSIDRLTFRDRFFAAGRIAVKQVAPRGGVYVGFFNSTRQGWRPWSSLMFQLTGSVRGELPNGTDPGAQIWVTAVTSTWRTDGGVTRLMIPADGAPHTWVLSYDPNATPDPDWPKTGIPQYFYQDRLSSSELMKEAAKTDQELIEDQLREKLFEASDQGLLRYDPQRGQDYWELNDTGSQLKGAVSFKLDDARPVRFYLAPGNRDEPVVLDRFGLVNQQTYGRSIEMYLDNLNVNGQDITLAADPNWESKGNRQSYVEEDFHGRQNFGFSDTNHAGAAAGEAGGTFWRVEPTDPLHGYYADTIGKLTLDDPLSFSGKISFTDGQPDAGMWFGYFNAEHAMQKIEQEDAGFPTEESLGITIDGPSRIGYYFTAFCAARTGIISRREGPIFLPTGDKHTFQFDYDPVANDGLGRITMRLDDTTVTHNLTPEQRKAGATFDHFGLVTMRRGGKFVTIYFDDLAYTARRPADYKPVIHPQEIVKVPFPEGGRNEGS